MHKKIKKWIATHYIISLMGLFCCLTVLVVIAFIELKHFFPNFETDYLTTGFQFVATLMAGLSSSIAVIHVANLQNKVQKEFLITQELNERERMMIHFYIDKISEFEEKHKHFISLSAQFIHQSPQLTGAELRTYFTNIMDSLVLVYRYQHVFRHMDLQEKWQKLEEMTGKLQIFFLGEAKRIDEDCPNPTIGQDYRNQFYLELTTAISAISDRLLLYQEERIEHLLELN